MKIGLLSDTHGYLPEKIESYLANCDEIWHAGDIGSLAVIEKLQQGRLIRAVHGNIDSGILRQTYPEDLRFFCGNMHVWITHIAGRAGAYTPRVRKLLAKARPDILVCGHSHILCVKRDPAYGNMWYLNPGALGLQGIHRVCTFLRFELNMGSLSNLEVIEFRKGYPT